MNDAELAISFAIFAAKQRDAKEIELDHILLGCLRAISRFGIASLGPWDLDLEVLGIHWSRQPDGPRPEVVFSQEVVELLDRAAQIAKSVGEPTVGVNHLLAAFANEESGLMGELKTAYGIGSASWRAAVAQLGSSQAPGGNANRSEVETKRVRDYLTPEEAAGLRCRIRNRMCHGSGKGASPGAAHGSKFQTRTVRSQLELTSARPSLRKWTFQTRLS